MILVVLCHENGNAQTRANCAGCNFILLTLQCYECLHKTRCNQDGK